MKAMALPAFLKRSPLLPASQTDAEQLLQETGKGGTARSESARPMARSVFFILVLLVVFHIVFQLYTLSSGSFAGHQRSRTPENAHRALQGNQEERIETLAVQNELEQKEIDPDININLLIPGQNQKQFPRKYVTFDACGHLEGSYLAAMMGIYIGYKLDRTIILPSTTLSKYFDVDTLVDKLSDMPIYKSVPAYLVQKPFVYNVHQKMLKPKDIIALKATLVAHEYVSLSCPIFSVNLENENIESLKLVWRIFESLQATPEIENDAEVIVESIRELSPEKKAVVLHLRFDDEWIEHCKSWSGDNCYENMPGVKKFLTKYNVPHKDCYLSSYTAFNTGRLNDNPQKINFLTKELLIPGELSKYKGDKYLLSQLEFTVAKYSDVFVGNSVDILDALIILYRDDQGLAQYHYNGGIIPLENFFPTPKSRLLKIGASLPWVFHITDKSSHLDESVRAAVKSALKHTTLKPYCIFSGSPNEMTQWLESVGVKVIYHNLSWLERLKRMDKIVFKQDPSDANMMSIDNLATSFMKTDIPILAEFDVEPYVLYTDVDVIFRSDIHPNEITAWPKYFSCGPRHVQDIPFPCDTGVILMNVRSLRSAHEKFLEFIFNSRDLEFSQGSGAQGAFNSYFKGKIDRLPLEYTWKPFWGYTEADTIIHFLGPKPKDYEAYQMGSVVVDPLHKEFLDNCEGHDGCKKYLDMYNTFV